MANKKKLGRQTLATLMAVVLSLSLLQMSAFATDGDASTTTTTTFTFDKVWDDSSLASPQHDSITVELKDQNNNLYYSVISSPASTTASGNYAGSYTTTDGNLWHCTVSGLPSGNTYTLVSETAVNGDSSMDGYTSTLVPAVDDGLTVSSVDTIEPCNQLIIKNISSPFVAVKVGGDYILWTATELTDDAQKTQLIAAIAEAQGAAFGQMPNKTVTYCFGNCTLIPKHGKVDDSTISYSNGTTTIDFAAPSVWSQFCYGRYDVQSTTPKLINSKSSSEYTPLITSVTKYVMKNQYDAEIEFNEDNYTPDMWADSTIFTLDPNTTSVNALFKVVIEGTAGTSLAGYDDVLTCGTETMDSPTLVSPTTMPSEIPSGGSVTLYYTANLDVSAGQTAYINTASAGNLSDTATVNMNWPAESVTVKYWFQSTYGVTTGDGAYFQNTTDNSSSPYAPDAAIPLNYGGTVNASDHYLASVPDDYDQTPASVDPASVSYGAADRVINIYYNLKMPTTSFEIDKTWADGNPNVSGITVYVLEGNESLGSVLIGPNSATASDGAAFTARPISEKAWSAEISGLPALDPDTLDDIQYSVSESTNNLAYTPSYSNGGLVTYGAVTITNTPNITDTVSFSGSKIWADDNNRDGVRPDYVEVQLFRNNVPMDDTEYTKTLNSTNGWDYSWTDLPASNTYAVHEIAMGYYDDSTTAETNEADRTTVYSGNGYSSAYGYTPSENNGNITNTYAPQTIDRIPVVKTWSGAVGSSIELALYANNVDTGLRLDMIGNTETSDTRYVSSNGTVWAGWFEPDQEGSVLYKYESGQPITYSVREVKLNGNALSGTSYGRWTITTGTAAIGDLGERLDFSSDTMALTVRNSYSIPSTPPTTNTDYTLTVQWVDENGTALAAPETSTISSGTHYNANSVSGGSGRTFTDYDYTGLATGSDPVGGIMNGNKTVTFVYTGTTTIPNGETPLGETPEETETAEIPEGETPLAEAPKTGDELALWILAAAASGTGLIWLAISGKKRKHDGENG